MLRKCRYFRIYLSLYNYQSKASRYSYGLIHLKTRVSTNQKHTIDSQKNKEIKHNTKEKLSNHQRKNKKNKNKKYIINWKTTITSNVKGLNILIKRHKVPMGPNQTEKLLHSKGNQKENKKTTYRMGENSFK